MVKNRDFRNFGILSMLGPKIELVLQYVIFWHKIDKNLFFWPKTPFWTIELSYKRLRTILRKNEFWRFCGFLHFFLLKIRLNFGRKWWKIRKQQNQLQLQIPWRINEKFERKLVKMTFWVPKNLVKPQKTSKTT